MRLSKCSRLTVQKTNHLKESRAMITIPEMKERCIEAAETFRRLRIKVGPGTKSGFWPEVARQHGKDYPDDRTRVIVLPTAIEIQRAEEFSGWVNSSLDEQDRKDLRQWVALKTSRNATIRGYCKRIGLLEHNYRRKIDLVFERLTFTVFGDAAVSCSTGVDDDRNPGQNRAPSETFWRDDAQFRRRQMVQRLLARTGKRIGSSTRAA